MLAAGFGELAAQLGAADGGDPVAWVHGVLAASPARWLLVFDNAPDRASVAPFVPPAGPGRVLITSRNQIWPPGHALDVPVLDPQVAAEFLVSRTGDKDGRAALDLAGELGGLPLALEQAAAYVQASGDSLARYLASFRRRPDLLGRGEPIGYRDTVATTWRLAFENLQEAEPRAVGLLRLLAFCAPEAIPVRLLLQPRPELSKHLGNEVAPVLVPLLEDELAADDAIAALRRYSLVAPAADGSVSVHMLVQAVTLGQMPAEMAQEWRQAASRLRITDRQDVVVAGALSAGDADVGEQGHHLQAERLVVPVDVGPVARGPADPRVGDPSEQGRDDLFPEGEQGADDAGGSG